MIQEKIKKDIITGLEARQVALKLLSSVVDKQVSLDGLTDETGGNKYYLALSLRDRKLVRAIIITTLRHYEEIKVAISPFLKNPLPKKARGLHHLIHLTVAQILYLEVPDYAAINLAVTLTKKDNRLKRFSALVNAIARQVTRNRETILQNQPCFIENSTWFSKMLEHDYGKIKMQAILKIQKKEPPLDLTVKENAAQWAQKLSGIVLGNHTVRLNRTNQNITELEGFTEGSWWVQDVAASLPVQVMGNVKDNRVGDLCAAPGGKTAQLAQFGADVTAFDLSKSRMERLVQNMERLKLQVKTHIGDVRDFKPTQLFDAVLCDAPCSSTGTVRRHPDIIWTKSPNDISRLAHLQTQLLEAALRLTKSGGTIVFSNCSLAAQEGEELIENFLKKHYEATLSPITSQEISADFAFLVTGKGFLRSTPADLADFGGMDGFFVARLEKIYSERT